MTKEKATELAGQARRLATETVQLRQNLVTADDYRLWTLAYEAVERLDLLAALLIQTKE